MKTVKDVAVSLYSFHCKLVGTCLVLHLPSHFPALVEQHLTLLTSHISSLGKVQ